MEDEATLSPKKVQEMMAAYGRDLNKEIKVLREKLAEERENFAIFRDKVAIPVIQHNHKELRDRDGDDPVLVWVVDLAQAAITGIDYSTTAVEFFWTEEEANRFVDAIEDPNSNMGNWTVTCCYAVRKSYVKKSAYHALTQAMYDDPRPH